VKKQARKLSLLRYVGGMKLKKGARRTDWRFELRH
jgi:hypothetical protein